MSVPKGKRGQSPVEYIHTARELFLVTMRKCKNYPKRYTFFLAVPTVDCARNIHRLAAMANFYPTNDHEWQIRIDLVMEALGEVRELSSLVEIANEEFGFEPKKMGNWSELIAKEKALLKGLLESDRRRRKKLAE